jgi:hypothetical protein
MIIALRKAALDDVAFLADVVIQATLAPARFKQEADLKGIPLQLSVEKDNPHALRFYKRHGCVVCGEDENAYHLEYQPHA